MRATHILVAVCFGLAGFDASLGASDKSSARSKIRLMPGLGNAHHPVSTKNVQAQRFFDQGLALVYGFNHEDARKSFQRAGELDPKLAMAWWGVALAVGSNYNFPVDPDHAKSGYEAIQRALSLQDNANEAERGYIDALSVRFSSDPKADLNQLNAAYREAMAKLVRRYPDDLDAATLYADAMMNLNPWKLWLQGGKPNKDTEEIVSVLESVLQRDPNHVGANHLYIHALEASPTPERALPSANRLQRLAPAAEHLVHMPAHIHSRMGDHNDAAMANKKALTLTPKPGPMEDPLGIQWVMLDLHNLHFLAFSQCMNGDYALAQRSALQLAAKAQPHIKHMAMMEGFLPVPYWIMVGFERWNDIMRLPAPDSSLIYATAQWHFARAMALAGLRKKKEAEKEAKTFFAKLAELPHDAAFDPLNNVSDVTRVQENLLAAAIMRSGEEPNSQAEQDRDEPVEALQKAIAAEDNLNYSEPPSWFPPLRPVLGRLLLEEKKPAAAEKVFRSALEKTPRYTPALTGLASSLRAQGREYEALLVDQQLRDSKTTEASLSSPERPKNN